jgi:hypothetical protein
VATFAFDSTRGQVVLFGGYRSIPIEPINDTWTWDGHRWTQRTSADNPSPRRGAAITDYPDRRVVLMFGGASPELHDDTWLWNGSGWQQVSPAHRPSPRTGAALTYDPIHHVVIMFGGWRGNSLNDTWIWDGIDWIEKAPATSAPARQNARLAFDVAHGNALLFGGQPSRYGSRNDTWTWDGTTWTEQHPTTVPSEPIDGGGWVPHQMAYDAARKLIVFVNVAMRSANHSDDVMETWTWTGTDWTRLAPSASPPVREGYGLVYDSRRSVTVFAGGSPSTYGDPGATWGWDGVNWSKLAGPDFTPTPAGLWPRLVNLAYDSTRQQVVLFGGRAAEITNDTWTWDGHRWSQRTPANSPPAMDNAAIADDPGNHLVLLFGGAADGKGKGETWLWNGSDWNKAFPAHNPSPRGGVALAYDPIHRVVLLFGGSGSGAVASNETWVWDGVDWTKKSPDSAPPARQNARLAFDVARGNAVLYGGFGGRDDTWTWDGDTWTERHPAISPPGLSWEAGPPAPEQMVYDAARKVIVFVDTIRHSSSTSQDTAETWTWNGTTWSHLADPSTPVRYGYGLAYDASRSLTVLAGGWGGFGLASATSTWGWNGSKWSNIG